MNEKKLTPVDFTKIQADLKARFGPTDIEGEGITHMLLKVGNHEGLKQADIWNKEYEWEEEILGVFRSHDKGLEAMAAAIPDETEAGYTLMSLCNLSGQRSPLQPRLCFWDARAGQIDYVDLDKI